MWTPALVVVCIAIGAVLLITLVTAGLWLYLWVAGFKKNGPAVTDNPYFQKLFYALILEIVALFLLVGYTGYKYVNESIALEFGIESITTKHGPVLANVAITDPLSDGETFTIPPGLKLEFVSSETVEWGHDPLDVFEALFQRMAIHCLPGISCGEALSDYEVTAATSRIAEELAAIKADFAQQGLNDKIPPDYLPRMDAYANELIDSIKSTKTLMPVDIDKLKSSGDEETAVRFWKRVAGRQFGRGGRSKEPRLFGPFCGTKGNEGKAPTGSPDPSKNYPYGGAGAAALVAFVGTVDESGKLFTPDLARTTRFGAMGDFVNNETKKPLVVRLVMNDNRPQDNVGQAMVWYRLVPIR